jgi:hypothetical protein
LVRFGWTDTDDDFQADAQGEIVIPVLTAEQWHVEVAAPGHCRVFRDLKLAAPETVLDVTLGRGGELVGRVCDRRGQPLAGATVSAPHRGGMYRYDETKAGADGTFRLQYLPLDTPLELSASCEGYQYASTSCSVPTDSSPAKSAEFRLEPLADGGTVTGRVADAAGRPVAGAVLRNHGNSSDQVREMRSDADGRFRLERLFVQSGDRVTLIVRAEGYAPQQVTVTDEQRRGAAPLSVTLRPGARIRGRVVNQHGQPIPRCRVFFADGNRGFGHIGGHIDADDQGRFSSNSLPPGCDFTFVARGYSELTNHKLPLDQQGEVTVTLEPIGMLRGRVLNAATGRPVGEFNVRLRFPSDDALQAGDKRPSGGISSTRIDPGADFLDREGRFQLDDLGSGVAWELLIQARGYQPLRLPRVIAAPADEAEEFTARLVPVQPDELVPLRGRVVDPKGTPSEVSPIEAFLARVETPPSPRRVRLKLHSRNAQGEIVALRLEGIKLAKDDFGLIGRLRELETLDLSRSNVTDVDLQRLGGLPKLRELKLWDTRLDGSGLAHLGALGRLERLELGDTKVTDDALQHLAKLQNLRYLVLIRTRVTDAGLPHVARLLSLQSLKLGGTGVTDQGLRVLRGLRELRGLTLDETKVSEAGLKSLAELPHFVWAASATATADELVRRIERSDHQAVDEMRSVGLDIPNRGRFQLLRIDTIPPSEADRRRGWQRFHVEMHWTVEAEKLDTTFYADFVVDRGAIIVHQAGIREADAASAVKKPELKNLDPAVEGPVQLELLEGLDVWTVRGKRRDVTLLTEVIKQVDGLSATNAASIERLNGLLFSRGCRAAVRDGKIVIAPVIVKFDFRYKPWSEVLESLAKQMDLSVEAASLPPGTFNYRDDREYTPTEAITLVDSVLRTKGYTIARRDRKLVVTTRGPEQHKPSPEPSPEPAQDVRKSAGAIPVPPAKERTGEPQANARTCVRTFLAAALAGKVDEAVALADGSRLPAAQIRQLGDRIKAKKLTLVSVLASETGPRKGALAITESVQLARPDPDGRDTGKLAISLAKRDDRGWLVQDIDFESEESLKGEVDRFLEDFPDAQPVPEEPKK